MEESKVTANDIRKALREKYKDPDWFLGFEVGDATGLMVSRHADAIAINQYPSRRYEVRGFEIKVSKQDLKRELEESAKADALAKYCNYWFLVVPKGLTDDMQIPEPWGIIEYKDGKLRQKKKAEYAKNSIDFGFMCGFIRGIRRMNDNALADIVAREQKLTIEHLDMEVRSKLYDYEKLQERLERLKKLTGIDLTSKYYTDEMDIKAMALAKRLMSCHNDVVMASRVDYITKDLQEVTGWIKKTLQELKKFSDLMNGGR